MENFNPEAFWQSCLSKPLPEQINLSAEKVIVLANYLLETRENDGFVSCAILIHKLNIRIYHNGFPVSISYNDDFPTLFRYFYAEYSKKLGLEEHAKFTQFMSGKRETYSKVEQRHTGIIQNAQKKVNNAQDSKESELYAYIQAYGINVTHFEQISVHEPNFGTKTKMLLTDENGRKYVSVFQSDPPLSNESSFYLLPENYSDYHLQGVPSAKRFTFIFCDMKLVEE